MPPCIEKATADAVAAGHGDWRSPGSRLSAAISRFYSTDHRRRLSPRVITSIRWPRTLIRSVVRASFPSAIGSAASSSITMDNTHHTITASRNVGSTLRLRRSACSMPIARPDELLRDAQALDAWVTGSQGPPESRAGRKRRTSPSGVGAEGRPASSPDLHGKPLGRLDRQE
jgi:hypothetical protein